jgi:drug/metabolite transporter (DMT)-like permease
MGAIYYHHETSSEKVFPHYRNDISIVFLPFAIPHLKEQNWDGVGLPEIMTIFLSGLFSIAIGSIVWYASVKLAGNIRTSVYSNFTPIWAMLVSFFILREKLGLFELIGCILVLMGVALSKFRIEMPGSKKQIKNNPNNLHHHKVGK